jgi:3-amino-5-hydroxybenzoate synthase
MSDDLPALLGGSPLRPEGPPSWPPPEAADALAAAWRDGSAGRYVGGHVERLEQRLAELHGVGFALTCGSGTAPVAWTLRKLPG